MRQIIQDKKLLIFLALGLVFFLASFLLICVNLGSFSEPLILHFDIFGKVDLTGDVFGLWNILLMGVFIYIVNAFLAKTFFYKERILAYVLLASNVLIAILTLVAVGTIVSLN